MYERFLDRAKKVMQTANQEAQRFNHEYIGTEHILLGLAKDEDCVAMKVLKRLGISAKVLRREVEKLVQSGSEMITMGRLPQTPRAKKVIEYAMEEARNLNHNYVSTEHLLLGMMREDKCVAAQALMKLGLTIEKVREAVLAVLAQKESSAKGSLATFEPDASGQSTVELTPDQLKVIDDFCEDAGIGRDGASLLLRIFQRPKPTPKYATDFSGNDFVNFCHATIRCELVASFQDLMRLRAWKYFSSYQDGN